jgi:hypothetical protein
VTVIFPAEWPKRSVTIYFVFPLVVFLLSGCATLAAKSRVNMFTSISKAYQWALESGNYHGAVEHLDPSIDRPPIDFKRYASIKVSQYTVTQFKMSDDRRTIRQDVEIQYFFLNQSVVKTVVDHQVWRYSEDKGEWLLQSGLPVFPK